MPGQVTDDSEMALTLLHSIRRNGNVFNQAIVAADYIDWHNSHPIDEGFTTHNAFHNAKTLDDVLKNSHTKNKSSLSNGCLMRIWSLMYYYSDRTDNEIIRCTEADCMLTHPNKECQSIVSAYCRMLKYAINGKSKNEIIKILDQYESPIIKSIADVVKNNLDYIVVRTPE